MNFWKKQNNKGEQTLEKSVCFFHIVIFYGITLLLTLGMMTLIFCFSGENADISSDLSGGLCERLLSFVNQLFHLKWDELQLVRLAEWIETPIRKCAHFTEYTLLSICANLHGFSILLLKKDPDYFAREKTEQVVLRKPWRIGSCLFCIAYAASDEIHQAFVPGRACRFFDVCVDTGGVLTGALLVSLALRCISSYKKGKKEKIGNGFVY